jgi:hypothetical protein
MKKYFKLLVVAVVSVYVAICASVYATQDAKIFPGQFIPFEQAPLPPSAEAILLKVDANVTLKGYRFNAKEDDAPLLLYFGGNADKVEEFLIFAKEYKEYEIVAFNYRGFFQSTGSPSEKKLFSDALKIYDTFANDKRVVLVGRSLGSGVASYVASKRETIGVVLITPFDSIAALAKQKYPFLPVNLLLKHKFLSTEHLGQTNANIAIIEVANDAVVPNTHTQNLIDQTKKPLYRSVLRGVAHGDILLHKDFTKELDSALQRILSENKT